MRELRLDPDLYEVIEPINVRSWDALKSPGKGLPTEVVRLWYYKANVIKRRDESAQADIAALIASLSGESPNGRSGEDGDSAMVAVFTDWQLGKRDKDGTEGVVQRVQDGVRAILERAEELRRMDRAITDLYVADLGDLMESCDGHYAQQTFGAELDQRQQERLCRHLLVFALKTLAPHFDRIVFLVTPSNHGENRKDGKSFTTFGDNADVKVAEQVAEILAENPGAFGHISFVIADEELDLTLNVAGTITTFAHGHQMKQGVESWWKGMSLGRQPAMDSALLITGHLHHLEIKDYGQRTSIIAPALESDSAWYRNATGTPGRPGILTLLVGGGHWRDLQVL